MTDRVDLSSLPSPLDLLVVGGGPAGTGAAFRARELGLSVLVIDYDDVLKRIRDYSKDKLILPSFGGGDRLRFPKGGELVSRLHFRPIDKDEMHRTWKAHYREAGVPVATPLELTGLAREENLWRARLWDHGERVARELLAKAVALAPGRGVPRRFDIPGSTEGIAFRLSDPALYVGAPALVVGGGTSAAEAVIAIANAKAAVEDATIVAWSYRGTKMPRVSKALADAFFAAYVGHGNIRYYPLSEPVAVVTGDDREEYLSIRVARKVLPGEPCETVHLEFAKTRCVACIGEDLPEAFLAELGIPLVTDGEGKKRLLVSPILETVQKNVFLAGDLLSQLYLETDDFAAGPDAYRPVKHPGNVKNALRDGVLVAEAVAQRLAGRTEIRVEIEDAEELDEEPTSPVAAGLARSADAPAEAPGPPTAALPVTSRLVQLTPTGEPSGETPLPEAGIVTLGRHGADLSFPGDETLSDRQASLRREPEGWRLYDEGGGGGLFLRLRPGVPVNLAEGAILRAGRQFLLLAGGAVRHFDHHGREVGSHPLGERPIVLGRESPDVTLDPADPSLSRRHLSLAWREGAAVARDLNAVNGTFLRVAGSVALEPEDEFQLGRQRLRLAGPATPARAPERVALAPAALLSQAPPESLPNRVAPPANAPTASSSTATVTFEGLSGPLPARPGQSICEIAEANGIGALKAECHAGLCGSDPLRILAGAEHLSPLDSGEADTLRDLCDLEPGLHRLACMAKVKGPVVVQIVRR